MIHIEYLTILIRSCNGEIYKDNYEWTATGVRVAPGVLEIMGCMDAPSPSIRRDLKHVLRAEGWKKVIYKHLRNGELVEQEIDLKE